MYLMFKNLNSIDCSPSSKILYKKLNILLEDKTYSQYNQLGKILSNKTDMSSRNLFLSSPHFWPNSNEKKKKNKTLQLLFLSIKKNQTYLQHLGIKKPEK